MQNIRVCQQCNYYDEFDGYCEYHGDWLDDIEGDAEDCPEAN